MAKLIEFTFKPNGEVVIAAKGYAGKECLAATAPYEKALGGQTVSDVKTPEYLQQAPVTETAKQGS